MPDKNWEGIKKIMKEVLRIGVEQPHGSAKKKIATIAGKVVEVTYVYINGIRKISNGWLK